MYREMYKLLFNATTDAIAILQKAQQECENLYLQAPENAPISLAGARDEESEPLPRRIDFARNAGAAPPGGSNAPPCE